MKPLGICKEEIIEFKGCKSIVVGCYDGVGAE